MPNLCESEIVLKGKPQILEVIKDICEYVIKEYKQTDRLEMLQKILGFKCEGWGRSADGGIHDVYYSGKKKTKLRIEVCTAWGSADEYWQKLCEKFHLKWCSYNSVDGEYWIVNDKKKKEFPFVAILDIYNENVWQLKEDYLFFNSQKELVDYFANNALCDHYKTLNQWQQVLEETDCGKIKWVERYEY